MKSRQGFVSNSSTTSFSVFGVIIPNEEEFLNNLLGPKKEEEERERADLYEEQVKEKYGSLIDIVHWQGGSDAYENCYIGKNLKGWPKGMKAEDKIQVLSEITKKINEMYPGVELDFFSDGGYDG